MTSPTSLINAGASGERRRGAAGQFQACAPHRGGMNLRHAAQAAARQLFCAAFRQDWRHRVLAHVVTRMRIHHSRFRRCVFFRRRLRGRFRRVHGTVCHTDVLLRCRVSEMRRWSPPRNESSPIPSIKQSLTATRCRCATVRSRALAPTGCDSIRQLRRLSVGDSPIYQTG